MKPFTPIIFLSFAFIYTLPSCQNTTPNPEQSSVTIDTIPEATQPKGFYFLKSAKSLDDEEFLPKAYSGAAIEIIDSSLRIYPVLEGDPKEISFKEDEGSIKIYESTFARVKVEKNTPSLLTVTFSSSVDPFFSKDGDFNAQCLFQREVYMPIEQGEYCFDNLEIFSSKEANDAIERFLDKTWPTGVIPWPRRLYAFGDTSFFVDDFYLSMDGKQFLFDPVRGVYRFGESLLIRFESDVVNLFIEEEEGLIAFARGNYHLLHSLLTHPHIKSILSSPDKEEEGKQEPITNSIHFGAYHVKQRTAACSYAESFAGNFGPDDIANRAFPEPNGPKVSLIGKEEPVEIEEKDAIVYITPNFVHYETMKYRFGTWDVVEPVDDRYLALTCGHDYDWWPKHWGAWQYEYDMPDCFRSAELNSFFCFYDAVSQRYRPCGHNSKADYTTILIGEDATLTLIIHRLANPVFKDDGLEEMIFDSYRFTYLEETIVLER